MNKCKKYKHLGLTYTNKCTVITDEWRNFTFFSEITSLVEDMHQCADKIVDLFTGKGIGEGGPSVTCSEESLMANPAKLCYVVKQALREAAVG